MQKSITFDDVLIKPQFSTISSRKDVDLSVNFGDFFTAKLPIISANMDTVTGPEMAKAMLELGAQACLHRFCSLNNSFKMFLNSVAQNGSVPMVSIGLGQDELDRAKALHRVGAKVFVIDVAHGAQLSVAEQAMGLRASLGENTAIVVGNFASADSVLDFLKNCNVRIDAIKVGIGPGSACKTRTVTGVGVPQLTAILEISEVLRGTGIKVIADGGMRTSADICKALGAGADMVMLGGMLAGTDEAPGAVVEESGVKYKEYRGSASLEAYKDQGKVAPWRSAEGEAFKVEYKGPLKDILSQIEGGIRSSMTYVNARNLKEYKENVEFVEVSQSSVRENGPHGKK
jgi:IMP dehydrogenase